MTSYVPGGPCIGRPRSRAHEEDLKRLGLDWVRRHLPHLRDENGNRFPSTVPGISNPGAEDPRRAAANLKFFKGKQHFMEQLVHKPKTRSRKGSTRRSSSQMDWNEFFTRMDADSMAPPRSLVPIYERAGGTPQLKTIPFPTPRVKRPFDHQQAPKPTLGRTIGLPKERTMQSWGTMNKTLYTASNASIDEGVVEMQRMHGRPGGGAASFSDYVHQARMKRVDLKAPAHIYKDIILYQPAE